MRVSPASMIRRLNAKLQEHGQSLRVVKYSGESITLSTGNILIGLSKDRFCKRVKNPKTTIWVSNMDALISGKISEKEIKSDLSGIGGRRVQELYGPLIRKNLNTGTPWNKGTKGQKIGTLGPRSAEVKLAIGKKNAGSGNGMWGVKMSDSEKKKKSDQMKQKILNREFTPKSNNRNTHWDSMFDGRKYRSSWEALYQYINPAAEYETLRIEYTVNNITRIYIVDFIDHGSKVAIEVKPKELCKGENFTAKFSALATWAACNGYTVQLADRDYLKSQMVQIEYSRFDSKTAKKIKELYEAG